MTDTGKKTPLVIIFGRVNVGKSALFNRLTEKNSALVSDIPGTTRDSNTAEIRWQGTDFTLVDTGGITDFGPPGAKAADNDRGIDFLVQRQARDYLKKADLVLFLVDTRDGLLPQRSVVFLLPGAEEAGLGGVQYFLKNPAVPSLENIVGYINMDAVGIGTKIHVGFAENYPDLYAYLEKANEGSGFDIKGSLSSNIGRPRLDAAFFDWYGIPVLSIGTSGDSNTSGNYRYHTPYDNILNINPEIMLNLAELLFHSIVEMANDDQLDINRGEIREEFIEFRY